MRAGSLSASVLTTLLALPAAAEDLAVVRSHQVSPYNDAMSGVKARLSGVSILDLDLSDPSACSSLKGKIQGAKVKAILAIGRASTQCTIDLKLPLPIIYCMVLDPGEIGSAGNQIAGVHLQIPPRNQLKVLHSLVPGIKTVAALYDPVHSSDIISEAKDAAQELGMTLLALPVSSIKDVFAALRSIRAQGGDALWMVPDPTVYNRDSMVGILKFTIENRLPFMASDKEIVRNGALCALSPRFDKVGEQAADMLKELLAGRSAADLPVEAPRDSGLYVNAKTAGLIGITFDPTTAATAAETIK